MPAPPYWAGIEMPSRPRSAICGRMLRSNLCARSSSRIRGATSRPAHSRTDCSRRRCSSVSSKFSISEWPAETRAGASAGFLNSTSRKLLLSRNCSVMRRSSNMRWMSRFGIGRCFPRAAGVGSMLKLVRVDDDVPRVLRPRTRLRLRRDEERQQHALGFQDARELLGELLGGVLVQIIEDIPAQDPVDAVGLVRKSFRQGRRQLVELAFTDVSIDVLAQVLDDDLAAELLAEEADVGADDRAEIEQHRLRARTQAANEARQDLRRMYRGIRCTGIGIGGFLTATREQIRERHRRDDDTEIADRRRLPEPGRFVHRNAESTPTRNRCGVAAR